MRRPPAVRWKRHSCWFAVLNGSRNIGRRYVVACSRFRSTTMISVRSRSRSPDDGREWGRLSIVTNGNCAKNSRAVWAGRWRTSPATSGTGSSTRSSSGSTCFLPRTVPNLRRRLLVPRQGRPSPRENDAGQGVARRPRPSARGRRGCVACGRHSGTGRGGRVRASDVRCHGLSVAVTPCGCALLDHPRD